MASQFMFVINWFYFGTVGSLKPLHWFVLGFVGLVGLVVSLLEYFNLKREYVADFKIRRQRKYFGRHTVLFIVLWLLFFVLRGITLQEVVYLILIILIAGIPSVVMYHIIKKKKPYSIYIRGNTLIVSNEQFQKRDLTQLTGIRYDRLKKDFWLDFKGKGRILLSVKEYLPEDMEAFLHLLVDKSAYDIVIPENYVADVRVRR